MFKQEKEQIKQFHELGYSCYALAKVMGLNYSMVKKYCRDNNIQPKTERKTTAENRKLKICEYCGKVFVRKTFHAEFCSDSCRKENWLQLQDVLAQQEYEENFVLINIADTPINNSTNVPKKSLAFSGEKSDEWKKIIIKEGK